MKKITRILSFVFLSIGHIIAQMNGNTLSSFLKDCYSEPSLLNRNNLPPMSLSVMLDIIRKIEDHPDMIGDMRQISTAIIHMFRQDGIIYDPSATGTQYIVPYSPTGFPAYKNRLLLTKLIPNNQFNLPSDGLTVEEKCALHYMISSSVLLHARGDEEWTCNRIIISGEKSARMHEYRKSDDIEIFRINNIRDTRSEQIMGISNCPMETGVVSTTWGDVAMGSVITGIASGLEEQNVLVSDLVTVKSGFSNNTIVVNNRYASTISGDIAETAIRQGMTRNVITVGLTGGWNSTNAKRHYFHTRSIDLEFTDAEIRGGLDGLILSDLSPSYVTMFPEFKLSQLIDMYYSNNGIMHDLRFRACNRKLLIPDIASTQILMEKSLGTAIALYHISTLVGTTNMRGIQNFVNNTVAAFHRYIPQNINDPLCRTILDEVIRAKVNLILITDGNIVRTDIISYILDNIEIGRYGSSITLLQPETGELLVDKTFSLPNFYYEVNKRNIETGNVNVVNGLRSLIDVIIKELQTERDSHYVGGNATVALFLCNTVALTGDERLTAIKHANWLTWNVPDIRLVFASTPGSEETVMPLLRDLSDFVPVTLPLARDSPEVLNELLFNIKKSPRKISNPLCGSSWNDDDPGVLTFDGFVDANGINLYRLLPNYFFDNNPSRLLRVQSTDYGPVSVCYSRTNPFPRRNQTSGSVPDDVTCESATNAGIVEIGLRDACHGASSVQNCAPLYFTVASTTIPIKAMCKDPGCRYPNDIKYLIATHELGCFNAAYAFTVKQNLFFLTFISLLLNIRVINVIK